MKAAVLHGIRDIKYEEVDMPQMGPNDVLIKVKVCGICGSDIPRYFSDAAHFYPIILGHEFSGVIADKGKNVPENISIGNRAAVAPLMPCHTCSACQKGLHSLCKNYKFVGSSFNGAMADFVVVPYKNIITFPDTVSFTQGAFFEPSTIGLHGLFCADYCGGNTVAILGVGTIGLFTMQWCKLLGARQIVAFDIDDDRLELAKKLGADEIVNTTQDDFMNKAQSYVENEGYEYVFETAGNNITMNYAFQLAGNRSTVCFIGTSSKDLNFSWRDFELMNRKEFNLTGSWMGYSAPFPGKEWILTSEYLSKDKLIIDENIIDTVYEMEEGKIAFERFATPGSVKGKILLVNE